MKSKKRVFVNALSKEEEAEQLARMEKRIENKNLPFIPLEEILTKGATKKKES